jgi:hypothetical protein
VNAQRPQLSGGVSPQALPEREAGLPPGPPPATYTPFGDRFTEANCAALIDTNAIGEKLAPMFVAEMRNWRGMPVAPGLTPVQRLAQRIPGTSDDDSFARYAARDRDPLAPIVPDFNRVSPRRDAAWMMALLALLAVSAGIGALVWP